MDIAGARASLNRVESKDADFEALDRIIKKHEATRPRIHASISAKDVANTTPSVDICQAREEGKKIAKSDSRVDKLRAGLDATLVRRSIARRRRTRRSRTPTVNAFTKSNVDGSVRGQDALDQEARVRRNFVTTIEIPRHGTGRPARGSQEFADADKELNAVYNENVSSYVTFNEDSATDATRRNEEMAAESIERATADYKKRRKSKRAAQHEWGSLIANTSDG